MHKAAHPSNYFFSNSFTYNQAEQIKKRVICVQILLEIHLTERGRFHFQGRTAFYTPSWSYPAGTRRDDVTQMSVLRHINIMHLQGSNVVFVYICMCPCIS